MFEKLCNLLTQGDVDNLWISNKYGKRDVAKC